MSTVARIPQADMDRTFKSIARSGVSNARVVMDFANGRIEVMIGESARTEEVDEENWDDETI